MRVKKLGGGRLEITRNGGKPLFMGLLRGAERKPEGTAFKREIAEIEKMSGSGRRKM